MLVVFKHENMNRVLQGEFFENLQDFALSKFIIKISEKGKVTINGIKRGVSYSIGNTSNEYTIKEAQLDYIKSPDFKSFAKSRFYTIYQIKEKVI